MNLTPREKDKLLISMAAMVARRRRERGVKLNHPEAVALITDFIVEGARDGKTVAELMEAGARGVPRGGGVGGVPGKNHGNPGGGACPRGTKPGKGRWPERWKGTHIPRATFFTHRA